MGLHEGRQDGIYEATNQYLRQNKKVRSSRMWGCKLLKLPNLTMSEIEEHENALRRDLEAMRVELKRDLKESELRLEAKISETKADLTRWIIGAGVLQTGLIIGVLMKIAKLI
jgi:hypothetical protein